MLNKDPDIFPEQSPLFILYSKSAMCMANNVKDIKHTRHVSRRVYFARNGENFKIHDIYWYEGCPQLAVIANKNVGEKDSNIRMKYIMVRLYN